MSKKGKMPAALLAYWRKRAAIGGTPKTSNKRRQRRSSGATKRMARKTRRGRRGFSGGGFSVKGLIKGIVGGVGTSVLLSAVKVSGNANRVGSALAGVALGGMNVNGAIGAAAGAATPEIVNAIASNVNGMSGASAGSSGGAP